MPVTYVHLANLLTCGNKVAQAHWMEQLKAGKVTTLETFWKSKAIGKLLDANPSIKIFLDSGAHSLLNAQAGLINAGDTVKTEKTEGENVLTSDDFYQLDMNDRYFLSSSQTKQIQKYIDTSFADNKDVMKYLDEYITFIHKYKDQLMGYVNLDIIYDAERSYKNQQYMESNGLIPIPVFHHTEDYKWLRKMAEEYDYIGIGGVATGLGSHEFVTFADECFKIINEVHPGLKVHGFAVTAYNFMIRWPWFSCDSTSWVKHAAYGNVICPRFSKRGDDFNLRTSPFTITVSDIAIVQPSPTNTHYTIKYSDPEIERIHKWFTQAGVTPNIFNSNVEEETNEELKRYLEELNAQKIPVIDTLLDRQKVNVHYYTKFLEQKIENKSEKSSPRTLF